MPREVVHDHTGERSRGLGVTGEAIHPSEVLAKHGVGGNAELLVQAVREFNPPALDAASGKKINSSLTEKLRAGDFEFDLAEIAGDGATVQADPVVRGTSSVVYVAADSQGTLYKGTFELDDPEGTHVSQAEVLTDEASTTSQAINPRLEARRQADAAADSRKAELDAREKAIAAREREVAASEASLDEERRRGEAPAEDAEATAAAKAAEAEGGEPPPAPERPGALPEGFEELNADDAAKVVAGLSDEDKAAAKAFETATKNRKTVLDA